MTDRQTSLVKVERLTVPQPLPFLSLPDAEVRYVNMTALTRGRLLSCFWVVDRKHIYIGSAGMNWKAMSKVKNFELTVALKSTRMMYECNYKTTKY